MQKDDIYKAALANDNFRQVLFTNQHSQVVLMAVKPGEDIGLESHEVDQILVFVQGQGLALIGKEEQPISVNDLVIVPAGTQHNFTNTGQDDLKLYTIYTPPEHAPNTVHRTKAEAEAAHHD